MVDSSERVLSLFAGIGGLDLGVARGLRAVGRDHCAVAYVEGEAFGVACLAAQMRAGRLAPAPVWSDVRTFGSAVCAGPVDGIIGGFPCQDISSAGKRAGIKGEKSGMFFEIARLVRELEPRWVFLENVARIHAEGLDVVLAELAALGLDAEWATVGIGTDARRARWFCLAYAASQRRESEHPISLRSRKSAPARGHSCYRYREGVAGKIPHPDDAEGLRRWGADFAEPAVCRGADGIPARVDRLRALGNAVVPAQAEAAFIELWRRAGL